MKMTEKQKAKAEAKLTELDKTDPNLAARKRRKREMDRLRHARNLKAVKDRLLMVEKASPVDEKVLSSTPETRAPREMGKVDLRCVTFMS